MQNNNIFLYRNPCRKHNPLFIYFYPKDETTMSGIIIVLGDIVTTNDLSAVSVSNLPHNRLILGNKLAARLFQRRHIGALTDSVNFTHRLTESVYWLFRSVN